MWHHAWTYVQEHQPNHIAFEMAWLEYHFRLLNQPSCNFPIHSSSRVQRKDIRNSLKSPWSGSWPLFSKATCGNHTSLRSSNSAVIWYTCLWAHSRNPLKKHLSKRTEDLYPQVTQTMFSYKLSAVLPAKRWKKRHCSTSTLPDNCP